VTPFENLWIALAIIFGIVGVVRGFLKELGVTLVMVVTLFGLTRLADNMTRILDFIATTIKLSAVRDLASREPVWLAFYTLAVLGAVFIAYQGTVIKYPGEDPRGIQGQLLALMIGLINGYLVAGSLWFYMDKYKETVKALGFLQGEYTSVAQRMLPVLPPDILSRYLPFLVVFMIILLVIK
jgi:hypothetical protein